MTVFSRTRYGRFYPISAVKKGLPSLAAAEPLAFGVSANTGGLSDFGGSCETVNMDIAKRGKSFLTLGPSRLETEKFPVTVERECAWQENWNDRLWPRQPVDQDLSLIHI